MMKARKRRQRRGAALVEAVFMLPIFFLFLFAVLEYGRYIFTVQLLNEAAREGARYAVVNTATSVTTTQIQNYVDQYLVGQGVNQMQGYSATTNIQVFQANPSTGLDNGQGWQNAGNGKPIGVTISGTYTPILGNFVFMGNTLPAQATCIMYSEAN